MLLALFLLSVFFFRIPNFYFIPFIQNAYFTTQALVRVLIVIIFCIHLWDSYRRKKSVFSSLKNNTTIIIILLFFSLQSLSGERYPLTDYFSTHGLLLPSYHSLTQKMVKKIRFLIVKSI